MLFRSAMGLEAWSRGAAAVHLVESDVKTHRILAANSKKISDKFGQESRERPVTVRKDNALGWLKQFKSQYEGWDEEKQMNTILFFDPPYEKKDLYQDVAAYTLREWFVGRVWIESDRQKGLSADHWEGWGEQFVKTYFQGTSYIAVLDLRG